MVGFSRVYLLQHFVIDVYFGAVFGVLSVVLGLFIMNLLFDKMKLDIFEKTSLRTSLKKKERKRK